MTTDTRYFKRTEPTILGPGFETFCYYEPDNIFLEWDFCPTARRSYEPIGDEL